MVTAAFRPSRFIETQASSAEGTASIAVNVPRIRLVLSAAIQVAEPKKFSYQRNEYARGGNSRRSEAEKESGTTTSVGSIKNTSTSAEGPTAAFWPACCQDRPQAWTAPTWFRIISRRAVRNIT